MNNINPTTCPKCSYVRKESDNAPLSECPNCGIYYEKYEAMVAARRTRDDDISTVPDTYSANTGNQSSRSQKLTIGMAIGLFLMVVVSFIGYQKYQEYEVHRLRQKLSPILKDATIRIERIIVKKVTTTVTEVDDPLLADRKELLQQQIVGIENNLESVQRLATNSNEKITGPVIQYVKFSLTFVKTEESMIDLANSYGQSEALFGEALFGKELDEATSIANKYIPYVGNDPLARFYSEAEGASVLKLMIEAKNRAKMFVPQLEKNMNLFSAASKGRIQALVAINESAHDLAKEFDRDALVDEKALKNYLAISQMGDREVEKQIQRTLNSFQRLGP
jgi:hypothetical protein